MPLEVLRWCPPSQLRCMPLEVPRLRPPSIQWRRVALHALASPQLGVLLLWKLLSATELRKQCRLLVPFLFGEANPNPNLKPTWLAIIAGRARPDEPEVVGGVQEEGW